MERSHIQKGNGDVALFVFFMSVAAQEEVNNLTQVTVSVVGHSVGSSSSDNLKGERERVWDLSASATSLTLNPSSGDAIGRCISPRPDLATIW